MKHKKFILPIIILSMILVQTLFISALTVSDCQTLATGGTITVNGNKCVHTFTTSGDFNLVSTGNINFIMVGGGGAGGGVASGGGGGGAGGFVNASNYPLTAGNYPIVVGAGGLGVSNSQGLSGENTSFNNIVAVGGGGGSGGTLHYGLDGGSGGGGMANGITHGGNPTQINYTGATGWGMNGSAGLGSAGAGGGGALEMGQAPVGSTAGRGGNGISSTIYNGTTLWYAGGGGGSYTVGAIGGIGGGGVGDTYDANNGSAGINGTGGGGGAKGQATGSGYNGGSGIVIISYELDTTPPSINFLFQNPSNITSYNVYTSKLKINYSITDSSGIKNVYYYSKTNSSTNQIWQYINGTQTIQGFQGLTSRVGVVITNISSIWNFMISSTLIYPSVFNLDPEVTGLATNSYYAIDDNSKYLKIRFFNLTNNSYGTFNFMANSSIGAGDLQIYFCNSTYTDDLADGCGIIANFPSTQIFNYTVSDNSAYNFIPFNMNLTTTTVAGIKITDVNYFILKKASAGTWYVYYVTNISRPDTIQNSSDSGTSWNNFNGTINAFVSQYTPLNYTNYYYVCANDTLGNYGCSDIRSSPIIEQLQAPTIPNVYSPFLSAYSGNISINYTSSESTSEMSYYNISLMKNNIYNKTISANNSLNLGYVWNSIGTPDGNYTIRVAGVDKNGSASYGYSFEFAIDNTFPSLQVSFTEGTTYSGITQLLNISTDGTTVIYNINGGANHTYTTPVLIDFNAGSNQINIWSSDYAGNTVFTSINFIISIPSGVLSNPIYLILNGSGAGLGIFFQILAQALPLLLIGLAMAGIIVMIGIAIKKYLIEGGSP